MGTEKRGGGGAPEGIMEQKKSQTGHPHHRGRRGEKTVKEAQKGFGGGGRTRDIAERKVRGMCSKE